MSLGLVLTESEKRVLFVFKRSYPVSVAVRMAPSESALVDFILGVNQVCYKGFSCMLFFWGMLKELDQFLPSHEKKGF